jgi:uncharacterized membrane protein
MIPVFVLAIGTLLFRLAGRLGVRHLSTWRDAARWGIAVMLLFTASAHFTDTKHDLAAMIPAPFPQGLELIYITGVLEIAGALGLLLRSTRRAAAIGLVLMLLALFPANVNAAINDIPFRGEAPTPLIPRILMQALFIGILWWTSIWRPASSESRSAPEPRVA